MSRREITAGKAVIVVDLIDRATANFGKITSKMMAASRAFREMGRMTAAGGILSGLASKNIISHFVAFEDQMLNLTAKLGYFGQLTVEQTQNINSLKQTILDLGRSTSYTSKEVADAAVSLAQAGFTVNEIRSSLQSVLDLARGTGYSLGETADLVANTIRTFNMFQPGDGPAVLAENMRTIEHVSSMMVKATRLGTIEIQDLRESLKYAAGSANNLGSSLPVILGLLVQMSESGLKASLAGTSMNTAFLNLVQNMEALKGAAPGFEVFTDAAGRVDFQKTFKSLMDVTSQMSRLQKTKLFQDIFNIRGARMISSIQEMERVETFIKEIAGAGQEARQSAAMMESGLGGAIRRLTSALDNLTIAWGYTFKDGATAIANFATIGVGFLEKLSAKYKAFIALLVLSPAILGTLAIASFTLSFALARLSGVLSLVFAGLTKLKSVGKLMGSSLLSVAAPVANLKKTYQARLAAEKKFKEKLAKQSLAFDEKIAKAQAAKNPAKALEKIFTSKSYQKYLSDVMKTRKAPGNNLLGRVGSGTKELLNTFKQRSALKSQIKLQQILGRKEQERGKKALAQQRYIAANESARRQKAYNFFMRAANEGKQELAITQALAKEQRRLGILKSVAGRSFPARDRVLNSSYDRLFKVRNILKTLPQTVTQGGVTTASQTFLKYKKEEAALATFINVQENKKLRVMQRIALAQKNVLDYQKKIAEFTKRRISYLGQGTRQLQQVGVANRINDNVLKNRKSIRAWMATRSAARGSNIAGMTQQLKGMSYWKSIIGMFRGVNFAKTAGGVLKLGVGFFKLAAGLTRFVFSWNFVGLALNALLLFGDKIPVIRKAFEDLGKGFTDAFNQMARIAVYAAPAFELFQLAFSAFLSGNSQTGVAAAVAGFQGLVGIIGSQLTAAWNAFAARVEYVWLTIKQIGTAIWAVIDSLISGTMSAFTAITAPLTQGLKAFGGDGSNIGESFMKGVASLGTGLSWFISQFYKAVITFHEYGSMFLNRMQRTFGEIINAIPGTGSAGQNLIDSANANDAVDSLTASKLRADINIAQAEREKAIKKIMEVTAEQLQDIRQRRVAAANNRSGAISNWMEDVMYGLRQEQERFTQDRARQQQQLMQQQLAIGNGSMPTGEATETVAAEIKRFAFRLEAVVGSIGAASKARMLVDSPKQIDEQKETNRKLDQLIGVVKTNGAF